MSSGRRHTTAITAMDALILVPLEGRIVGVWVANAMRTYTLHDASVVTPELFPGTHVVICPPVKGTGLSLLLALQAAAYRRFVSHDGAVRAFEGLLLVVGLDTRACRSAEVCTLHASRHARICSHSQAVRHGRERNS